MQGERRIRKIKVIATIGPACDSLEILKALIGAGMNVARLNLSHDTHEQHAARLERIRQASQQLSANVAVMLSGETARGRHPVEALRTMARLALQAEASLREYGDLRQIRPHATQVVTAGVSGQIGSTEMIRVVRVP